MRRKSEAWSGRWRGGQGEVWWFVGARLVDWLAYVCGCSQSTAPTALAAHIILPPERSLQHRQHHTDESRQAAIMCEYNPPITFLR